MRRLASALAGPAGDADDLVQDAFVSAPRAPPDADRPARPRAGPAINDKPAFPEREPSDRDMDAIVEYIAGRFLEGGVAPRRGDGRGGT